MAVFAGRRLQLAFQQALQVIEALRLIEQRFQGLRLAHQCGGGPGRQGTKRHGRTPEIVEPPW